MEGRLAYCFFLLAFLVLIFLELVYWLLTSFPLSYFEQAFDEGKPTISANTCEKAWIYERVPGYELAGYDNQIASNVPTRIACEELCLEAVDLPCRSAEYDYENFICRLSTETRRTQPAAYR